MFNHQMGSVLTAMTTYSLSILSLGFPKLISPKAKAGQTLFGPIKPTNPSV